MTKKQIMEAIKSTAVLADCREAGNINIACAKESIDSFNAGNRGFWLGKELEGIARRLEEVSSWYATSADVLRRAAEQCRQQLTTALCAGRHPMPCEVEGAIFSEIADPTNFQDMEAEATRKLFWLRGSSVTIYVTGLTPALIAVINAARRLRIDVVLMHYDRAAGNYIGQVVR